MLLPSTTLQRQPWRRPGTGVSLRHLGEDVGEGDGFGGWQGHRTSLLPPPKFGTRGRVNTARSGRHEHLEIHHHRGGNPPAPQPGVFKNILSYFFSLFAGREKEDEKKRGKGEVLTRSSTFYFRGKICIIYFYLYTCTSHLYLKCTDLPIIFSFLL